MSEERKEGAAPARKRLRGGRVSGQVWMRYILSLLAWAAVVAAGLFAGWSVCQMIVWQPGPVWEILCWIRAHVMPVLLLAVAVGWLVISYHFISKPLRYLEELVEASQRLAVPDGDPIVLPPAMRDAEDQLNLVRQQALRAAQTAREAEQRKNDLIVYLAHDLKTPLTSVIGYLTLLRDEQDLSPQARERYTGIALEKAERLEDLINEFFDITRFNLTQLELDKRPTDIRRMLEQVTSEFEPVMGEKGLRCRLDLPQTLTAECDPDKLARVFDNLLRNACHYSYPDTVIHVEGRESPEALTLTFTNQGPTIPPDKLEHIFQQFFRLDAARTTQTGGAGLGLAIAKEIVERHGGTIQAQSGDERIVFTVRLPRP